VSVLRLGLVDYRAGLALQQRLLERLLKGEGGDGTLLLLQHPPTYTTGIRTKEYSLTEEKRLKSLGADFVRTQRGGLITFHGPGQLVAYPILNLRSLAPHQGEGKRGMVMGMKWYVWSLEEMVISLLDEFGIKGCRSPHTGVWVPSGPQGVLSKVCAMGVANKNMVTSHGLALNCRTDLTWFDHIVPCGIQGAGVTSLHKLLDRQDAGVDVDEVGDRLLKHFESCFQCETFTWNEEPCDMILEGISHSV